MFSFFKKAYKPIVAYSESWTILQDDEENLLIRVNAGLKDAVGHTDYPIKVGVAIPVQALNEMEALKNAVEDALREYWQREENGVIVAVIMNMQEPGFVEILSYAKQGTDIAALHLRLKEQFPREDIQMHASEESDWATYSSFLP